MYNGGKAIFRYPYRLTLTLIVIFYVVPLKGELCSTLVSVNGGENSTALQEKAFANFKSTCRKSQLRSAGDDALPCYGPFTPSSDKSKNRYPQEGSFDHPLERLEFSVQSTNSVFLDLKASNKFIAIELGRSSSIYNDNLNRVTGIHKINIETTTRFWMTYTNNKLKVGRYEDEAPFMEAEFLNMDIKYITFDNYGTPSEWQIYKPCVNA